MSLKFRLAFLAIALGQVFLLLGLIGDREYTLRKGTEVVLETLPVDPRSLFQGDFAILRYEISRPPEGLHITPGVSVFVYLEEGPESWRAVRYETGRSDFDDRLFIKGRMGNDGEIDFGIGTFFVPEGTGLIIEQANDIKVVVSVDGRGKAVVKDVLVDGVPFNVAREEAVPG